MLTVQINAENASARLETLGRTLADSTPLFQRIAGMLEEETEANFSAQGRPDWVPLSAATREERLKRNRGSSVLMILQDRGILAASVSSDYGPDFALIGAGGAAKDYAAIQQFGGTINRAAHSTKTRLRTDSKGELLRQGANGRKKNLAVFAKDSHKRVQEKWSEVGAFSIEIPARPYLPFLESPENATLQPEAERKLLDILLEMIGGDLG